MKKSPSRKEDKYDQYREMKRDPKKKYKKEDGSKKDGDQSKEKVVYK